ncbi:kinesin-like protein KIF24 isoform X3 [Syngnathus scovelli]|nr:kinesin-like protein KIF24 isoform X3 [Syngnathus scovelli]XP_049619768.1 kinesin-like protein KIF24 isoform X3 [Syngnathus scovelli]
MTLSLFECLKVVGLDRLHERFTSMGIRQAGHLVALTSDDLSYLEIHTAEDKSRLHKLVHLVQTLEQGGLRLGEAAADQGASYKHSAQINSHRAPVRSGRPDIPKRLGMCNTSSALPPQKNVAPHSQHQQQSRPRAAAKRCTDKKSNPMPVYEAKRKPGYNYGLPLQPVSVKKQTHGPRIIVCVRKRPLTHGERKKGEADVVITPSTECVVVEEGKEALDLTQYILQHPFYFDQVFGESHSNEEVYKKTAYPLVQHMLDGGKATCFAFGQTGAGKTHTMMGSSPGEAGIYVLAVQDIFAHLSATRSPMLVYVSFCEIYCRQLYDLLNKRKRLCVREDSHSVVHIAGLCDVRVDSVNSLLKVISQGLAARTKRVSSVNPLSSRSHALLQIQLRSPNQQIVGRMWFIDLAGSERASDTTTKDWQTRMEGAEINQSLLALKECIRSLDQEQRHTPFRQSKLTQVLKDSFVGNSMTCMIANISPSVVATEHTLNTLRYADRVKELRGRGGEPESKTTSSSKCSVGKTPTPRATFASVSPTSRNIVGCPVDCSTPRNGRHGEERAARAKNGVRPEEARNCQEKGDGRLDCNKENWSTNISCNRSERRQNGKESTKERDVKTMDEELQQQHLQRYHQQLQMCMPLSVSPPSTSRQSLCSSTSSTGHLALSARRPGSNDTLTVYDSGVGSCESFGKDTPQKGEMRWSANPAVDAAVVSFNTRENGEDLLEMDPSLDGLWTDCLMSVSKTLSSPPAVEPPHQEAQSGYPISSACELKNVVGTFQEKKKQPQQLKNTQLQKYPEDETKTPQDNNASSFSQCEASSTTLLFPVDQSNSHFCPLGREKEPLTHAKNKDRQFNLRSSTFDTKLAKKHNKELIHAKGEDANICHPKDFQSPTCVRKLAKKNTKEHPTHAKKKDDKIYIRPPTCDTKLISKYKRDHHTHTKDDVKICLPVDHRSPTSDNKFTTKDHFTQAKNKHQEFYVRPPTSDAKLSHECIIKEHFMHAKDEDADVCVSKDISFSFLDTKLANNYNLEHFTHAKGEDCLSKDLWSPTSDAAKATRGTPSCAPKKAVSPSKNMCGTYTMPNLRTTAPEPGLLWNSLQVKMDDPTELHCKEQPCDSDFSGTVDHAKWRLIQAHWEKLRKMEPLLQEEQTLLSKQPNMAFVDYVDKLEEILNRNAQCLRSMRTKLRLYRMTSSFSELEYTQAAPNS